MFLYLLNTVLSLGPFRVAIFSDHMLETLLFV